eukprot:TRINITY_DN2117_c0_g1_i4.p1 TRINITY_DN2117_c0_g1~~TRINITY_DN2117_c0_g1_i4.p1  ORF type:complete len:1636 (+),score=493.61 TRINITY_DN2117_c0_g1_i4:118-5025(+)
MIAVQDKKLKKKLEPQLLKLRDQDPTFDRCDFSNCKFTESDLKLVFDLVEKNNFVKEVTLLSNRIQDDGGKWLAGKIRVHPCITAVDVRFNNFSFGATGEFVKAAKNNLRLIKILLEEHTTDLDDFGITGGTQGTTLNPIPVKLKQELDQWLAWNAEIQNFLRGEGDTINLKGRGFNNDVALRKEYFTDRLSVLDLSENELTRLPDLTAIKNLKSLSFSKNKITVLPSTIGQLSKLEVLVFNENLIANLPPELGLLANLRVLEARSNKLTAIPEEMANMGSMQEIDLRKNKIKRLPFFLADMKALKVLQVADNDLDDTGIPKNLLEEGQGQNLLGYLKELSEGHKKLCRMRLMIVGQENVGKTTLLRALTQHKRVTKHILAAAMGTPSALGEKQPHENDSFDQYNLATDGIDITEWELDDDIMFSAWDFAGQEVYYATHQFFLSHRAIYCICFNMVNSTELSRVEYWLQSISTRGKGAPVILVGTHADDKSCTPEFVEELWNSLKKKYARFEVKHFFAVSGKTKQNVLDLEQSIEKIAKELKAEKFGTEIIPDSYLTLEKRIKLKRRELLPPILSLEEFKQLALTCNVREENVPAACAFLSELGVIVHFPEVDSGLHDVVILSPQWVTSVFASVVTLKHNFIKKDGMLALADLYQHIWNSPEFPKEIHQKLLQMLIRFEICFHVVEVDKLLIPSLLPSERPNFDLLWSPSMVPEDHNITQYKRNIYLEFTPKGFTAKLIIRLLYFTQPHSYWQDGILVSSDDDFALAEVDQTQSLLTISVRGAHKPAELFRLIVETVDILVDSWFNIKASKYIPCTHCLHTCKRMEDVHLFKMQDIEAAVSDGVQELACAKSPNQKIPIDRLAPDIVMQDFKGDRIDLGELKLGKILGSGSFGRVYKGIWKDQIVAVKEMKLPDNVSKAKKLKAFNEFRREVWLMSGLKHPNVVNLLGFSMNPFLIIMEMVAAGDLYKFLNDKSKVCDWPLRVMISLDMSRGMEFLHSQNPPLLHRDLKTPNVFLAATTIEAPVRAKVADFGFSSRLYVESFKAKESADREVNNPTWLAPEVLAGKGEYGTKSDVYAMGIMMWEVMSREHPFSEYEKIKFAWQLEATILEGKRPSVPDDDPLVPVQFKNLMKDCWAQDPKDRPEFTEVTKRLESIKIEDGQVIYTDEDPAEIAKAEKKRKSSKKDDSKKNSKSKSVTSVVESKIGTGSKLVVQGAFLKKLETAPASAISRLYLVDNLVWCVCDNGNIFVYNAENAQLGESHVGQHNGTKITAIQAVDKNVVWTGGDDIIQIWSNEELIKWPETRGILQMKSGGLISGWESRWCVLKDGCLTIQTDKGDDKLLNAIQMDTCTLTNITTDKKRPNCFQLSVGEKKKFVFSAKDKEQHTDWFNALNTSIDCANKKKLIKDQSGGRVLQNKEKRIYSLLRVGENQMWVGSSDAFIHVFNTTNGQIEREIDVKKEAKLTFPPEAGSPMISSMTTHQNNICVAVYDTIVLMNDKGAVIGTLAGGHDAKNTNFLVNATNVSGEMVINHMISVGDRLWSCSCLDNSLAIWDLEKKVLARKMEITGFHGPLSMVLFGFYVWTSGCDGKIKLWNSKNCECVMDAQNAHTDAVTSMAFVFNKVWSGSVDKTICIWK